MDSVQTFIFSSLLLEVISHPDHPPVLAAAELPAFPRGTVLPAFASILGTGHGPSAQNPGVSPWLSQDALSGAEHTASHWGPNLPLSGRKATSAALSQGAQARALTPRA